MILPVLSELERQAALINAKENGKDLSKPIVQQMAVAQAQRLADLRWFMKWGDERCPHSASFPDTADAPLPEVLKWKRFCDPCRQELKAKLAELEGKKCQEMT